MWPVCEVMRVDGAYKMKKQTNKQNETFSKAWHDFDTITMIFFGLFFLTNILYIHQISAASRLFAVQLCTHE